MRVCDCFVTTLQGFCSINVLNNEWTQYTVNKKVELNISLKFIPLSRCFYCRHRNSIPAEKILILLSRSYVFASLVMKINIISLTGYLLCPAASPVKLLHLSRHTVAEYSALLMKTTFFKYLRRLFGLYNRTNTLGLSGLRDFVLK